MWTVLKMIFGTISILIIVIQFFPPVRRMIKNGEWLSWHGNSRMNSMLRELCIRNPGLCRIHTIGKSVDGVDILSVEISENVCDDDESLKPEVRFDGNIHANEIIGRELLLRFAHELIERFERDDKETVELMRTSRLFVMPSLNPDGYPFWHGNRHGIDLNRNFPDPQIQLNRNESLLEPETRAFMEFVRRHHFVASVSIHMGTTVVAYPWSGRTDGSTTPKEIPFVSFGPPKYQPHLAPDDSTLKLAAFTYARNNFFIYGNPLSRYQDGIVNGAAWYVTYGESQDWDYFEHGTIAITAEVSVNPIPWGPFLLLEWNSNERSLYEFAKFAKDTGIRGTVKNSFTGEPIVGAIVFTCSLENVSTMSVHTDIRTGYKGFFSRPLAPGEYLVGTYNQTKIVNISQKHPTIVDFVI